MGGIINSIEFCFVSFVLLPSLYVKYIVKVNWVFSQFLWPKQLSSGSCSRRFLTLHI